MKEKKWYVKIGLFDFFTQMNLQEIYLLLEF